MDIATIVTAIVSSMGLSVGTVAWLSQKLVGHRLEKDLETFKSSLEQERSGEIARLEGSIKQKVEATLGEIAAELQYKFDAKKRLYTAIGPLRFQLLMACRDLAGRILTGTTRPYEININGYYGRSTLYRILRPLCLSELIERQIAYADFSVDPDATDLLKFKKGAFAVFSGGSVIGGHPNADWNNQVEHVFFDNLSKCANILIVSEEDSHERVMRHHEFEELLKIKGSQESFNPFPSILEDLSPQTKPLFWTRLIAYGNLCNDFINKKGKSIGFEEREFPVSDLLKATQDPVILKNIDQYIESCKAVPNSPL